MQQQGTITFKLLIICQMVERFYVCFAAYSVYRLACQHAKCEDTCPENSGCFSYYRYTQYVINIRCDDFYGTDVASTITLNIQQNTPPSFTSASKCKSLK